MDKRVDKRFRDRCIYKKRVKNVKRMSVCFLLMQTSEHMHACLFVNNAIMSIGEGLGFWDFVIQ